MSNEDPMRDIGKLTLGHVKAGTTIGRVDGMPIRGTPVATGSTALAIENNKLKARLATLEAHVAAGRELAERIEVIHDSDDPLSWIEIDPDDWKNILAHLDGPDTPESINHKQD